MKKTYRLPWDPDAFAQAKSRQLALLEDNPDLQLSLAIHSDLFVENRPAGSPYWKKEFNAIMLVAKDGVNRQTGFEWAQIIDMYSIGGIKNERYALFDDGLAELYAGPFEAGARPITGIVPVQIDGEWILIQIDSTAKSDSTFPDAETFLKDAAGEYSSAAGGDVIEASFSITEDGQFRYQDLHLSRFPQNRIRNTNEPL